MGRCDRLAWNTDEHTDEHTDDEAAGPAGGHADGTPGSGAEDYPNR